jgi:hypothetical protein
MPSTDHPPLPLVLTALQAYVDQALRDHELYEITGYGWSDCDTMDPEFAGHALWQTRPPAEPDWERIFGGGLPQTNPSPTQETLVTHGEDFIGAMEAARQAAGLALCLNQTLDPGFPDDDHYWFHTATCALWLGIASDRIRDYFLLALFGQTDKEFFKTHKQPAHWAAPFSVSLQNAGDQRERELLTTLESLGQVLRAAREERHTITHAIATRTAQRSAETLSEQRTRATNRDPYPSRNDITFEELRASQPSTYHRDERAQAFQRFKAWYECLVRASNLVFEIEYNRREAAAAQHPVKGE